jgi:hypothetical protein
VARTGAASNEIDVAAYRDAMSESDFTESILDEARAAGWRTYHIPDWLWKVAFGAWKAWGARKGRRWPDRGFPDLVLLRPPELLFVEVKAANGRLDTRQRGWLRDLEACGVEVYLWKPRDLETIRARLTRIP